MSLEPKDQAGLALSSISLLGQLFGGTIKVLERYHKAENLSADALDLKINLEWARSRLETWGTGWGVEEGQHLKNKRFQKYGLMAMNHLVLINYMLLELSKVDDEFQTIAEAGKFATAPVVSMARLTKEGGVDELELKALQDKIEKLSVDANFQEKVRWAIQDREALKKVREVKSMIEDLFLQFPPPNEDHVAAVAKNKDLQSNDEATLDAIVKSTGTDPLFASLTTLKVEQLRLERRAEKLKSANPDEGVLSLQKEEGTGLRRTGVFFSRKKSQYPTPVLIEFKELRNDDEDLETRSLRIHNVARLLSMDQKPNEMRTLHCLGIITSNHDDIRTHKLLYKLPNPGYFTLIDMLKAHRDDLPLGKKFACARIIARGLLYLHLAGWLHKGIRSSNVIFSAEMESDVNLAEPYISGFEYSRPATSLIDTEAVDGDLANNLYRHPKAQGLPLFRQEYMPAYDVYSLGIVLLELGHQRSLNGLMLKEHKERKGRGEVVGDERPETNWSAPRFRTWLLRDQVPKLVPRMGEIYTNVVRACLEGIKSTEARTSEESLYLTVVKKLDQCRA